MYIMFCRVTWFCLINPVARVAGRQSVRLKYSKPLDVRSRSFCRRYHGFSKLVRVRSKNESSDAAATRVELGSNSPRTLAIRQKE